MGTKILVINKQSQNDRNRFITTEGSCFLYSLRLEHAHNNPPRRIHIALHQILEDEEDLVKEVYQVLLVHVLHVVRVVAVVHEVEEGYEAGHVVHCQVHVVGLVGLAHKTEEEF